MYRCGRSGNNIVQRVDTDNDIIGFDNDSTQQRDNRSNVFDDFGIGERDFYDRVELCRF